MNILKWNDAQVFLFFFVFLRVVSIFVFLPIFSDKVVPTIIKILFSLAFSFVCFPLLMNKTNYIDMTVFESFWRFIFLVVLEMLTGILIGFVTRWIFEAIQFAGHFMSTAMGFSIATVLDPHSETQTIALAELQYILACMLFLSLDGHHLYVQAIVNSFDVLKPGGLNLNQNNVKLMEYLIQMTSEVLMLGLKLAAPVIVVTLLINFAFGLISRAVPQVNILSISFSVNILVGLMVCFIAEPSFFGMIRTQFESFIPEFNRFMRLLGG